MSDRMVKATLRRSAFGTSPRQCATLQGLGLRRIGRAVILKDSPAGRGCRPVARVEYAIVHLGDLAAFPPGSAVEVKELRARGLVRGARPVKCLADGTLSH